jgi:hypothetical protein
LVTIDKILKAKSDLRYSSHRRNDSMECEVTSTGVRICISLQNLSSIQFRHFSLACFDFDDPGNSVHEENVWAVAYQVKRAVRVGHHMNFARDLGKLVPSANKTSQIGYDPMSISLLFFCRRTTRRSSIRFSYLIASLVGVTTFQKCYNLFEQTIY